jgi:hypothetical protein
MVLPNLAPVSAGGDPPCAAEDECQVERRPRTNLFLTAQLILPGQRPLDVRVRNLSATGAKIDMADPPASGTTLLLCRGAAQMAAEVMWSGRNSCGLRFTQFIDVARWMLDRPGALSAGAAATFSHEPSLADDLALARQLADRLEEVLSAEPTVVAALGTELQALDLLGQLLRTSEKRAAGSTAPAIRSLWQAAATFLRRPIGEP